MEMNGHRLTKMPKISDDTKNTMAKLLGKEGLVIVGPSGTDSKDNHMRIYIYGGRIGGAPLGKAEWELPSDAYKNHNSMLEEYFSGEYNKEDKKKLYEQNDDFLKAIVTAAKNRFKSEGTIKERAVQTDLVRKYLSKELESGYIICDMEHAVPQGKTPTGKKRSDFDIIILNPHSGKAGLIELKSNSKACENIKSGLKAHLEDILDCMNLEYVRDNILYRYACLQNAGLISKDLPKATDIEPIFSAFGGFLFIDDGSKTLSTKKDVVEICEKCFEDDIKYLEEKENKIRFLYADSANDVDFTQMQSWVDFKKS